MKYINTLLIILIFQSLQAQDKFDAVKMKGVKVELLSEVAVVQPGKKFTVAIHIEHFEGFHTYWKNPGMVGFATQITWDLPKGFKAGAIKWQVPERSKMLKYNCHGYEGETFLLADIEVPNNVPDDIKISANIGGMSCSEKSCCSIGYANTSVSLKAGPLFTLNKKNSLLISGARSRLPKLIKDWDVSISKKDKSMILSVKGIDLKREDVYFFPDQNIYDTEVEQKVNIANGLLTVEFKLNDFVPKDLKVVTGLLYSKRNWADSGSKYLLVRCPLVK
jgi:DsbC/DsbD-like thiol-disulfide interchange protein